MNIYVYGTKKKKKKEICDDTFLFILLFAMHALSRGGEGGKEEEQKIKGKRRNTCHERDPMRVNRYIWSLP